MIARNPKNHVDQWLVEAKYFTDNFEPLSKTAGEIRKFFLKGPPRRRWGLGGGRRRLDNRVKHGSNRNIWGDEQINFAES